MIIYTDGSCINNGLPNASAGIGVYFGPGDSRNISAKIGRLQASSRAELEAIRQAIIQLGNFIPVRGGLSAVVIRTDSQNSIDYINNGCQQRACGTTGTIGVPSDVRDIVMEIVKMIGNSGYKISLQKVSFDDPGINCAHKLAEAAARR
ncbi:hypothetical protein IWW36_002872 [Coemansia brasiliensis]|uniref:ribonuclease H n=1 Tax=Coemansia brasiliensis TaxID=2650707 RepID=A0A9W8I8U8_9FUNG|nr:hypothetical protein IWW36_002872 [Coemansia brasiliensis]